MCTVHNHKIEHQQPLFLTKMPIKYKNNTKLRNKNREKNVPKSLRKQHNVASRRGRRIGECDENGEGGTREGGITVS